MDAKDRFTMGFYVKTLTRIVAEPRHFFSDIPDGYGFGRPMGFLLVSGFLVTVACILSRQPDNRALFGAICLFNALGMVLIAAGIGYLAMVLIKGRRTAFSRVFSVFAFSSGVTLLASWVPFFFWIIEPWKWWLVGTGLTRTCGLRNGQAALVIMVTIVTIILFFKSFLALPFALNNAP